MINGLIRYLRFEYDNFYPLGGMDDCVGAYSTFDEAMCSPLSCDHGLVYDTWTGERWVVREHHERLLDERIKEELGRLHPGCELSVEHMDGLCCAFVGGVLVESSLSASGLLSRLSRLKER